MRDFLAPFILIVASHAIILGMAVPMYTIAQ